MSGKTTTRLAVLVRPMLAAEAEDAAGASQLMLLSAADHTVAVRTSATATTGQRFRFAGPGAMLVPPSPSSSAVLASEVRAIDSLWTTSARIAASAPPFPLLRVT